MTVQRCLCRIGAGAALLLLLCPAQAQLVNYTEQLAAYKGMEQSGVRLTNNTYPSVMARARVNFALARRALISQSALLQPDGTLRLPDRNRNIVIHTDYTDVQQDTNGGIRIASPVIQGDVNGNVTLYVEGGGLENITVINGGGR